MALTNTYTTGGTFPAADANAIATAVNAKNQVGTFAGRPAAGNLDAIYYCTDNDTIYHDNGSAWEKIRIASDSTSAMGDVPSSGWTAVNMGSATFAADKDAMLLTLPTSSGGWVHQYRSYPTPPFTLVTYVDPVYLSGQGYPPNASSSWQTGITISDGTKYIFAGPGAVDITPSAPWITGTGIYVMGEKYTNATTFSAAYNSNGIPAAFLGAIPKWYSYTDDATNITWKFSLNGIDWVTLASEARTTFLTPSRIGVGGFNNGGATLLTRFRSWNGVS